MSRLLLIENCSQCKYCNMIECSHPFYSDPDKKIIFDTRFNQETRYPEIPSWCPLCDFEKAEPALKILVELSDVLIELAGKE